MIDLTFIIVVGVIGLIIGEITFLILKYFMMKEHHCYESELENLQQQLRKGELSELLYRQMGQDFEEQYHVARYNRLGNLGGRKVK